MANDRSSRVDLGAPLLSIEGLHVSFIGRAGTSVAVRGADLRVPVGTTVGVVGESGSGKSVTMMAVMGLLPPNARVRGTIRWKGAEVDAADIAAMRGRQIAMVFQDPMTSLNPLMTVGDQVGEVLRVHHRMSRRAAQERTKELLSLVGIPSPADCLGRFPHQFSGGMRQRVMIASALAAEPELLIADEPTTALDVTIQAQILELLADLQERLSIAVIFITHDLAVVAEVCQEVAVMYSGRVIETGTVAEVLGDPHHPYTRGLLAASPRIAGPRDRLLPIAGSPPETLVDIVGCAFADRCPHAAPKCDEPPPIVELGKGRRAECWIAAPMDTAEVSR